MGQEEFHIGGAERDRTVGLLNAIQALSQLSYSPMISMLLLTQKRKHCQFILLYFFKP
jgi:hypothetical protein